jgi:hypothetical protein
LQPARYRRDGAEAANYRIFPGLPQSFFPDIDAAMALELIQ